MSVADMLEREIEKGCAPSAPVGHDRATPTAMRPDERAAMPQAASLEMPDDDVFPRFLRARADDVAPDQQSGDAEGRFLDEVAEELALYFDLGGDMASSTVDDPIRLAVPLKKSAVPPPRPPRRLTRAALLPAVGALAGAAALFVGASLLGEAEASRPAAKGASAQAASIPAPAMGSASPPVEVAQASPAPVRELAVTGEGSTTGAAGALAPQAASVAPAGPAAQDETGQSELARLTDSVVVSLGKMASAENAADQQPTEASAAELADTLAELVAQAEKYGRSTDDVIAGIDRALAENSGAALPKALAGPSGQIDTKMLVDAAAGKPDRRGDTEKSYLASLESEGNAATVAGTVDSPRIVVVAVGDSLSRIAFRVYGDPLAYPRIFSANRDVLARPDALTIGMTLRIP